MDIRLDSDIITNDGEKAGTVGSVILNPDSHEVVGVIAHQGFLFTKDRIIDREFIDRVDGDGTIHLNDTSDKVDDLPEFVEAKFTQPDDGVDEMAFAYAPGRTYFAPVPTASLENRPTVTSPTAPAPNSPMEPAPVDPPPQTVESNLPPGAITINEGTEVVDRNGDSVGEVAEVIYGESQIEALVVKAGIIFTHDVRIPVEWVQATTEDRIQIDRTADEAERLGRVDT